jgi:hypothetical protein
VDLGRFPGEKENPTRKPPGLDFKTWPPAASCPEPFLDVFEGPKKICFRGTIFYFCACVTIGSIGTATQRIVWRTLLYWAKFAHADPLLYWANFAHADPHKTLPRGHGVNDTHTCQGGKESGALDVYVQPSAVWANLAICRANSSSDGLVCVCVCVAGTHSNSGTEIQL